MTRHIDISQLTLAERILLVEELWDSLAADQQAAALTPAQEHELGRRLDAADRGQLAYSSWDEVKRRHLPKA